MAAERGNYLVRKLTELKKTCPAVGDIRGMGLVLAVEMVSDQSTKTQFPSSFASTEKIAISHTTGGISVPLVPQHMV